MIIESLIGIVFIVNLIFILLILFDEIQLSNFNIIGKIIIILLTMPLGLLIFILGIIFFAVINLFLVLFEK